jgi:azurin
MVSQDKEKDCKYHVYKIITIDSNEVTETDETTITVTHTCEQTRCQYSSTGQRCLIVIKTNRSLWDDVRGNNETCRI